MGTMPSSNKTGLPAFDESGRKEALKRIAEERSLQDGDLRIFTQVARELLKAEMVDTISKDEIWQECLDGLKEDLLKSIGHEIGLATGSNVVDEVVDELASEIINNIMSAFIDEVAKNAALVGQLVIDKDVDGKLTFEHAIRQVSGLIAQLQRQRLDIQEAISGLDPSIQRLVTDGFKRAGLL